MATGATGSRSPDIDDELVTVTRRNGLAASRDADSGSECFVPPVDVDLWVAEIADDVLISAMDPENLERKVDAFLRR